MKFSKSCQKIGDGKVTHATFSENCEEFLIKNDGAIYLVKRLSGKKVFSRYKLVSFADECFFVFNKILERKGNDLNYVS